MKRVPNETLDYREDGLFYSDDEPFTGISVFVGTAGRIEAEHEHREGMRWGISKAWWEPDFPEYEEHWSQGLLHGMRREWHSNGQLAVEENFEYGIRLRGKRWDEQGKLLEEFCLGKDDPDFETLQIYRNAYKKAGLDEA